MWTASHFTFFFCFCFVSPPEASELANTQKAKNSIFHPQNSRKKTFPLCFPERWDFSFFPSGIAHTNRRKQV
jgi:hypothetical protein